MYIHPANYPSSPPPGELAFLKCIGTMATMDTQTERGFDWALSVLRDGKPVARSGWNAHHFLGLQIPDEGSVNTLPYIYMIIGEDASDLGGKRVPWVASQTDLLSWDWFQIAPDGI